MPPVTHSLDDAMNELANLMMEYARGNYNATLPLPVQQHQDLQPLIAGLHLLVDRLNTLEQGHTSLNALEGQSALNTLEEHTAPNTLEGHNTLTPKKNKENQEDTVEALKKLARQDGLTQLPNRTLFQETLHRTILQAKRYQQKPALLYLDLNRFKPVNDQFGHLVGDQLLKSVANRLTYSLRESDFVARLGGDEFAVILTNINKAEDAATAAQTIIKQLSAPHYLSGQEIYSGVSIGIACFPEAGNTPTELIRNADIAMYRAKENVGDSYAFYTQALHEQVETRIKIEQALRTALDNKEFHLVCQPQIDLLSNHVIGAETLLRWEHPTLGNISPKTFIPIAEEIGVIYNIGYWVIEQACHWYQTGLSKQKIPKDCRLSINVSIRQLEQPDFLNRVQRIFKKSGITPNHIEFEFTESTLMTLRAEAEQQLQELHQLGVAITIDDFGTGYSCLSRLSELPIDNLKIDYSLIHQIDQNNEHAAVVKSIIALANQFNFNVVAKGIEREEELQRLLRLGCYQGQGFYLIDLLKIEHIGDLFN